MSKRKIPTHFLQLFHLPQETDNIHVLALVLRKNTEDAPAEEFVLLYSQEQASMYLQKNARRIPVTNYAEMSADLQDIDLPSISDIEPLLVKGKYGVEALLQVISAKALLFGRKVVSEPPTLHPRRLTFQPDEDSSADRERGESSGTVPMEIYNLFSSPGRSFQMVIGPGIKVWN